MSIFSKVGHFVTKVFGKGVGGVLSGVGAAIGLASMFSSYRKQRHTGRDAVASRESALEAERSNNREFARQLDDQAVRQRNRARNRSLFSPSGDFYYGLSDNNSMGA